MQSRAAVLSELNRPLQLLTLTLPELKSGQALVEVAYSGLCQSQLLEIRGKKGPDPHLPHVLGHEGSGTVLAVGKKVRKVKRGDHVVLTWIKGKGADVPSTVYTGPRGQVNSGAISTFMTRTIVSENRLVRIPAAMPLREAALLGCAVPTGAGMMINTARVGKGSSVAVFGVGGIGLGVVVGATISKAGMIIAVDVQDHKLKQARKLGATHGINARTEDPLPAISRLTGGKGVDFAVESAGRRETMEACFQSVRDQGGLCILAGNLPKGERISIDPFDLIKGKRIVGTWGGETQPDRDIPRYVSLYRKKTVDFAAMITHEFRLDEINHAFDELEHGRVGRALIKLS